MNRRKRTLCVLACCLLLFFPQLGKTQVWSLDSCISYAYAHNLSVKTARLLVQSKENTYNQSRNNKTPTLNFSTSLVSQFGRSIDPTTNSYTNTQITYNSMGLSSEITLFNWFSVRNNIRLNYKNVEVAKWETERVKNDLKMNIVATYLQFLLAEKQLETTLKQIDLTIQQLEIIAKMVDYGKKPESDRIQMVGQLSLDSTNYFNLAVAVEKAKTQLKAFLSIDQKENLEIGGKDTMVQDILPQIQNPEPLFSKAFSTQPLLMENLAKLEALDYQKKIAKAAFLPTVSGSASVSSNYSNKYFNFYGQVYPYFNQLFNINLYQYVGLSINVPIANNKKAHYSYRDILIQIKIQEAQNESDNQQLKKDIYDAYNTAKANLSIYMNSKRTLDTTEKGYAFAQKRFALGKSTLADYLTALNTLYQARISNINSYYSYALCGCN